jgi:hypothetical protein
MKQCAPKAYALRHSVKPLLRLLLPTENISRLNLFLQNPAEKMEKFPGQLCIALSPFSSAQDFYAKSALASPPRGTILILLITPAMDTLSVWIAKRLSSFTTTA